MRNPDQAALDNAAQLTQTIRHAVGRSLPLAQLLIEGRAKPEHMDALVRHLADSSRAGEVLHEQLVYGLGAKNPGPRVDRDGLSLHQLDTPATRALLEALETAARAARAVDLERGWVDEDMEEIGFAPLLEGMAMSLGREVHGAMGSGRE